MNWKAIADVSNTSCNKNKGLSSLWVTEDEDMEGVFQD